MKNVQFSPGGADFDFQAATSLCRFDNDAGRNSMDARTLAARQRKLTIVER